MTRLARNTDPVTSHEAAREILDSGRAAVQRQAAARCVVTNPGRTSLELSRLGELDRYQLARRLPEIESAGLVFRAGIRRDEQTGRSGVCWWPVSGRPS